MTDSTVLPVAQQTANSLGHDLNRFGGWDPEEIALGVLEPIDKGKRRDLASAFANFVEHDLLYTIDPSKISSLAGGCLNLANFGTDFGKALNAFYDPNERVLVLTSKERKHKDNELVRISFDDISSYKGVYRNLVQELYRVFRDFQKETR